MPPGAGVGHELRQALELSFGMAWEILWALVLGFLLSAIVQALVSKQAVERRLADDSPRSLASATAFGAASSSCSYAAVALARSLFLKGAHFTSAIAMFVFAWPMTKRAGHKYDLFISSEGADSCDGQQADRYQNSC